MNASERLQSSSGEFGYPGLGMRLATADLGHDLVIEDLDEAATALIPTSFCPSPSFDKRPAISGYAHVNGPQILVSS